MARNHPSRWWPLRVFRVVDDSMRPTLNPSDVVLAWHGGAPRHGQLRVFRHPHLSTRWLVKRVDDVYGSVFHARSDNPRAAGASDSHDFGPVSGADTYRVIWTLRASRS
jgi:phage repressor protein C with HTH and peptisase S24 domain